jgi:hypothetical protein
LVASAGFAAGADVAAATAGAAWAGFAAGAAVGGTIAAAAVGFGASAGFAAGAGACWHAASTPTARPPTVARKARRDVFDPMSSPLLNRFCLTTNLSVLPFTHAGNLRPPVVEVTFRVVAAPDHGC